MFHPADDSIPLPEWRRGRDSEQENFAWPPVNPHFGQRIIRNTIAVPVYGDGRWGSKRVNISSKEATKEGLAEQQRQARKKDKGLVDEAVAFFRMSPDERDGLREEDEDGEEED